jgi:hypothetical protein
MGITDACRRNPNWATYLPTVEVMTLILQVEKVGVEVLTSAPLFFTNFGLVQMFGAGATELSER